MRMRLGLAGKSTTPPRGEKKVTRNGAAFDPTADYWHFSTNGGLKNFDLPRIAALCSFDITEAARKTLTWFLESRSVPHTHNLYNRLIHFLQTMQPVSGEAISRITNDMVYNYRERLSDSNEWYLGSLRGFFLKSAALGYPVITTEAADLLTEMTLKGNEKGWAVLTMDEEEGPFTDAEFRLVRRAVTEGLDHGGISLRRCALSWIYVNLGPRSSQVSDLKVKDLEKRRDREGKEKYVLMVPRVKQRHQKRRAEFKERELATEFGQILHAWCSQVAQDFGQNYGEAGELPMFPCHRRTAKADPGFEYHPDSVLLRSELINTFNATGIISPRTGEPIKIVPKRFRYTLGVRAVLRGAGAVEIADLLDHSDLQNVLVYTKLSDELVEELKAELNDDMELLAQAFRGEIVLFDQKDLADPTKLISYPGLDIKQVSYTGKCRCGGECGDVPPIFCYSCSHFTAFKGAPHEEVLDLMLAEQAREREEGSDETARELNESIAACRAVIMKCREEN